MGGVERKEEKGGDDLITVMMMMMTPLSHLPWWVELKEKKKKEGVIWKENKKRHG